VGGGSAAPPRLIEARWRPRGSRTQHVVLVGKGITFDSGGVNRKPGDSMTMMFTDMAGGAAVLGALHAIAAARLPVRVTALVPAAENMLSGSSYRPGDVIRHVGGRTSEVGNTDAEGRLVLADALAYAAARLKPSVIVDIATLTGAMKVALGLGTAGLFATSDSLAGGLTAAGAAAGEPVWRMPMPAEYEALLESPVADATNSAGNPGAITAALFLRPFVKDVPWAHLDIAGPARAAKDDGMIAQGATGFGARLLAAWVESLA
jgi:leucyl aminopeptidase